MNISTDAIDTSQTPSKESGELPGRMVGGSSGVAAVKRPGDVSGDLKKAPPGMSGGGGSVIADFSKPSGDVALNLKKSSAAASKKVIKEEDHDEDNDDDDDVDEEEEDVGMEEAAAAAASSTTVKAEDEKSAPKKRRSRKKWKKPKDKPSRPLSAYNLFFRKERAEMLGDDAPPGLAKGQKRVHRKTHGKIGFADMARIIGAKWKGLPDENKTEFEEVASKEKERYKKELAAWKENEKKKAAEAKKNKNSAKSRAKVAKESGDEARDASMFFPSEMMLRQQQEEQWMRMQMMHMGGGFPFASMSASQRPSPAIDYLRVMQGGSGAGGGGGSMNQYPNASENTASALLNQFQGGMGSGAMDVSGRSMSELERLQQIQMARMQTMQMMNSSMMGGPGSMGLPMSMGGHMPGPMGFGSSHMGGAGGGSAGSGPPSSQQQQLEQLQQMRMMNQLQGGRRGSAEDAMDHSTRRTQNRFPGPDV